MLFCLNIEISVNTIFLQICCVKNMLTYTMNVCSSVNFDNEYCFIKRTHRCHQQGDISACIFRMRWTSKITIRDRSLYKYLTVNLTIQLYSPYHMWKGCPQEERQFQQGCEQPSPLAVARSSCDTKLFPGTQWWILSAYSGRRRYIAFQVRGSCSGAQQTESQHRAAREQEP